jgi:hypothetical protein
LSHALSFFNARGGPDLRQKCYYMILLMILS